MVAMCVLVVVHMLSVIMREMVWCLISWRGTMLRPAVLRVARHIPLWHGMVAAGGWGVTRLAEGTVCCGDRRQKHWATTRWCTLQAYCLQSTGEACCPSSRNTPNTHKYF